MKAATKNPRQLAIRALADVLDHGLHLADSPALQDNMQSRDLSMARHLAYAVLRWLTALDWLAQQLLNKPLKTKDSDIYRLILLGLYQLWLDAGAEHAAIHESAECARLQGKPWAVGVINAVLRRFQREREKWTGLLAQQDEQFAHPLWMLNTLRSDWPLHWLSIVHANNVMAPLWLRVNCNGPGRHAVIERLEDQGFEVQGHPSVSDAIRISPAAHVSTLDGFAAGHFSVQDPAAQLAADLVEARAGMRVLDACAAPGGKTCHLLERTPGIQVTAVDLTDHRIDLIRQNLSRLKLNCTLIAGDAAEPQTWWDGKPFQRILLDAPCSATGVIRRHPDIKHLRSFDQVASAIKLQQHLLQQLWPLLEVGGILVYATCSLFKDENCRQVSAFLARQEDAREQAIDVAWGHRQIPGRQIFPGDEDMDGFFYAVIRKVS